MRKLLLGAEGKENLTRMVESLGKLSPKVTWKIENITNEMMNLGKKISRQNVKCQPVVFVCLSELHIIMYRWREIRKRRNC